ncbi:hypothetical protein FACS1894111_10810 [Clostridia bacterium]|nr:hypothetical protein FACS1894111_10810 [Clostridia bacterium]
MPLETSAILRSILLHILKSKTVDEAFESVKSMCAKEDVDAVMEAYHKWQEQNKQ